MPGMDGFETAEVIKQRERTSTIPIIFLTALSKDEQHVFRGYEVGAVDYVFKPFNPEILRAKVAVFVELWEKNRQIRDQAELLRGAGARRAAARERGAVPPARGRDAADRLDRRRGGPRDLLQPPLVRVHRHDGGRARRRTPGRASRIPTTCRRRSHGARRRSRAAASSRSSTASSPHDGTWRWHLGRAVPIRHEDGSIDFWIGTATDIDDRKRTEEAQRFLLDAGAELSALARLARRRSKAVARVAVPRVADWCAVHVVEDGRHDLLARDRARRPRRR